MKVFLIFSLCATLAFAQFSEDQLESLAFIRLNPCERAIWSCCQSDQKKLPTFCFERNGCFGLQWLGEKACSDQLIDSIGVTLESTKDQIRRRASTIRSGFVPIFSKSRPKK